MALGAGRKGLASELVDEFGYLKGEIPTGEYYTKSQVDNKFETKTHAVNTYQKKTLELPLETLMGSKLTVEDSLDALNEIQKTRQPKTLEVPIEMLSGSKLTVESALQGLNTEKISTVALSYVEHEVQGLKIRYQKKDNIVTVIVSGEVTTAFANQDLIDTIPNDYKMAMNYHMLMLANDIVSGTLKTIDISGTEIVCNTPLPIGAKPRGCITAVAL